MPGVCSYRSRRVQWVCFEDVGPGLVVQLLVFVHVYNMMQCSAQGWWRGGPCTTLAGAVGMTICTQIMDVLRGACA